MSDKFHPGLVTIASLALSLLCTPVHAENMAERDFLIIPVEDIAWQPYPGFEGLFIAVLYGNPQEEGLYVIRAKFLPGRMSRPHYHSTDRLVTVMSGTWYAGIGDKFDPDATTLLAPGSFMVHPAGAAHFDGAKDEEVIVEIRGFGPVTTTLIE